MPFFSKDKKDKEKKSAKREPSIASSVHDKYEFNAANDANVLGTCVSRGISFTKQTTRFFQRRF